MDDAEPNTTPVVASSAAMANSSFSATTKKWSKWASTFFKKEKPLGSEPWFNPEADTKQKREWLEQQQAQAGDATSWPEHIYENFYVLGLPPDLEVTQIAEQLCELERKQRHHHDSDADADHDRDYIQPPQPSLAPQVLFRYPAGSVAPISDEEVAALAFPTGVAPEKLKRTASLSALDELIMGRDSDAQQQCFVFMLKVGGNFPLYGCCWYVREMLHRPPYLAQQRYRSCKAPFRQCMIAAPRCYCLLSHYPFFELHFRVLKIILDLERLERLLEYDTEKSRLPPPIILPSATAAARSSTGGRPSSPARASLSGAVGGNLRGSQTGMAAAAAAVHHRPLAGHGHMSAPVVHNRHSYCVDCAGIIEDMCPFTPGVSPVPGSAPWPQGSRKKHQVQLPEQPHQGGVPQQGATQQPQQLGQTIHLQPQQQSQQQQPAVVQGVQPGVCEVCGKPLRTAQTVGDARIATDMDQSSSTAPAGAAGMAATDNQETTGRRLSAAAAGSAAAAAGPLEVGVMCHSNLQPQQEQQQQQLQQPGMPGFAAGKAWVAQTGSGADSNQQSVFDAVAASVAGFDSVAAAPVVGSSNRSSSTGAAEGERWGNWHNLAAAIRGSASAPMTAMSKSSAGQADDGIVATESEPVQPQETSLVQRMWDVWAPKTAPATPAETPRSSGLTTRTSGLAGFLRRSSRTSISQLPAQPEQHDLVPLHHKQQQQGGSNHVHAPFVHSSPLQQQDAGRAQQQQVSAMQQLQPATGLNAATGGPAATAGPAAVDAAPAGQEDPACGLDSRSTASQQSTDTTATGDTAHAAAVVTADLGARNLTVMGPTDVQNKAASVAADTAVPVWAQDPDLQPLSSFRAFSNNVAIPQHNAAATSPAGQAAAQNRDEVHGPLAAGVAAVPTTAGHGSSVLAARAVHKHSPSVASNASSFHSALEQLDAEHAADATAGSVQPTLQTLVAAAEEVQQQQQQPAGHTQHPPELELPRKGLEQDSNISIPPQNEARSQNGTLHEQEQPQDQQEQQEASIGHAPSSGQVPLSPMDSCTDGERLVSAFAAIAAIAAPFAASTAGANSVANSQHNGLPLPAAQGAAPAGGDQLLQSSAAAPAGASMKLPRSLDVERSSSCDGADGAHVNAQGPLGLPDQLSRAYSQPSTGSDAVVTSASEPLEQQQEQGLPPLQPQGSVHRQPLSRNVSGRRSALFQEVSLRRSGEMSAELCRTISHLVQVDSAALLSAYRSSPVPLPGELYRLMLGDLYRLEFERVLPQPQYTPPGRSKLQHQVLSYAEVECAQQLQLWTVAALCRSLSLENILTMLNAVLLEKQLVVFFPHIGTLAAIVLSLVPLLRPFSWQSLMLPVTPTTMMGFLEAPVPFVLGVQYKTPGVVSRCHGLMRVNVYKNGIKNASFPSLANARQLMHALAPHHSILCDAAELAVERPVHVITPDEEAAASNFLSVLHGYLSQLCGDLRLHTIVNVGMTKRTGVFMKDSLIDSLQPKDRPFMRAFVETQMFAVYADGVISDYCET